MTQQHCTIKNIIEALTELQGKLPSEESLQDPPTSKKATGNNIEQPNERRSGVKKPSLCDRLIKRVKNIGKASNHASDSGGSQGGSRRSGANIEEDENLEIRKLHSDIRQMKAAFENLAVFQDNMIKNLSHTLLSTRLEAVLNKTGSFKPRSHDLKEIRRKVFNLKCEIPSLLYKQSSRGLSVKNSQTAEENSEIVETGSDIYLPSLHISKRFKNSPAFEEILEKFEHLDFDKQLCLLSFAVFPENREIKKTKLMYWWIGEEFISCDDSENSVKTILDDFSRKGLLEEVEDERKLEPSSYKMEPHVHSAVIHLAESMGIFNLYSSNGTLTMEKSSKHKVCLVKGSSLLRQAKKSVMEPKNLETIFNSSERYPDFTFKWFRGMDSLTVLYLGRWEQTAKRHIEVESTKFLKEIKYLKNLRLASFQGISRIEELGEYICKLSKLVILDLKACYNLERLPEDIGRLESLIYLDVSECYMLDSMPEGIEDLTKLQVLKGFVISQSDDERNCAVKKLVNLRKLSVTVNKESFKTRYLVESLVGLRQLENLKIIWGARYGSPKRKNIEETNEAEEEDRVTTNKDKENQGVLATEKKKKDLQEGEDDQEQKKGHTSEEKKGDVEETGKLEDGVSSKKEDGRNEEDNLRERKKHEDVKEESLKSDKVVQGEKKTSLSQEATETIQNKIDDHKGKKKVEEEGDGDKGKADLEERKKQDEVEAEKSKSDKVVEGEKKAVPPRESSDMIQKKPDDKSKVEKEGDGDKENNDIDEGKKREAVEAERSKPDKVVKEDEKTSPPPEPKETIQNKTADKTKVEKEGDGDKGKANNTEEGKKHDEVETESSKSDKVVEKDEKTSPPQESKDTIQNKTADKTKVEKEGDGDKGKANNTEEGKKHDEVETENSKSDKVVEKDEKTSPPQESKDTIQNKTADKTKVEKEGDGDKGKANNTEEGKKHDEVEAESTKSYNGVDGVKKASASMESINAIQNKPDDHQRGEKQEEKRDGNKGKAGQDEEKKKNEVKTESSKPDKVIEGDEKTSPPKDSIDTIQRKPDNHREISKVQDKGDGGKKGDDLKMLEGVEAKTQKSEKTTKLRKKVSFSENTEAQIQKKPDDLNRDKAMGGESHETPSPSKPPQESGLSKANLKRTFTQFENKTKNLLRRTQENPPIDTSELLSNLKKLELECFPKKEPPSWLNPEKLNNLKKLSIKGGKLSRISGEPQTAGKTWNVQILRLKYLHEFKVEWRNLQALFPKMILLEKYECPKIAFCPTDGNGVWRPQPQKSPDM